MLPVLSPDGTALAFSKFRIVFGKKLKAKFSGRSIWMIGVNGGRPRQLTPWRNGVIATPTSFSQDGNTLAISWETLGGRSAAKGIRLVDGSEFLIRRGMAEPIYSPDGSKIAAIKRRGALWAKGDLFVMNSDGSGARRITDTPSTIESAPSWDPSGERLVFTRMPQDLLFEPFGPGTAVIEVNTDGTCLRQLLFDRRAGFYGAAWRPGPGREAGRIAC
jgi:TolB protein